LKRVSKKNNNKIRQHEKKTHLSIPSLPFPCPMPFLLKQLQLQLPLLSILTTGSSACSQPSLPPPQQPVVAAVAAAASLDNPANV
jgi:hypothetical protein